MDSSKRKAESSAGADAGEGDDRASKRRKVPGVSYYFVWSLKIHMVQARTRFCCRAHRMTLPCSMPIAIARDVWECNLPKNRGKTCLLSRW